MTSPSSKAHHRTRQEQAAKEQEDFISQQHRRTSVVCAFHPSTSLLSDDVLDHLFDVDGLFSLAGLA